MRIRLLAALAVVCASIPFAGGARADQVSGARSELVTERSHTIDLRLAQGHATLRVRRVLDNEGPRHDQATVDIDLPSGAVAVGLRTLGTLNGEHHWFEADLMEAEAAAAKYKELTGIGGYYPKDPALLSWRTASFLKLQVFPVAPKSLKTIEYTLEMPTDYEDGRDVLHLSPLGTDVRTADVIVSPADPRDTVLVGGKPVAAGTRVKFHESDALDVVLARHDQELLGGTLASVAFATSRVLHHGRIEVAPRLSRLPKAPSVVVVLDASSSIDDADGISQSAAAGAYLSSLPDAKVEVITFDRAVHRRYGRLVAASTAIRDLGATSLSRKNGSAVDLALAEAESVLLASPPGPRRVVLVTDLRTRRSLDPAKLQAAFAKSGALLHVGTITQGFPSVLRNDDGDWAKLARATGGVLWSGSASNDPSHEDDMKRVYEEWARPIRIDHLAVKTPGLSSAELAFPDTLAEGEKIDLERIDPSSVSAIVMSGELWSTPLHASIHPDPAQAKLWSALVFGTSLLGDLSEREMMTLAKAGHAVSPVTSLLAIEPGVRPSTEGLEEEGGQGFGNGHGRLGGSHITRSPRIVNFDPVAFLQTALGHAWRGCGGGPGKSANVQLETTRAEIVDVMGVTVEPASKDLQSCLVEATWGIDLPSAFEDERSAFSISL